MMRMIFAALLGLYPERIRRDFAAEMLDVFEQASEQARRSGRAAYFAFVMRELGGLMVNLVIEGVHVTHRRNCRIV